MCDMMSTYHEHRHTGTDTHNQCSLVAISSQVGSCTSQPRHGTAQAPHTEGCASSVWWAAEVRVGGTEGADSCATAAEVRVGGTEGADSSATTSLSAWGSPHGAGAGAGEGAGRASSDGAGASTTTASDDDEQAQAQTEPAAGHATALEMQAEADIESTAGHATTLEMQAEARASSEGAGASTTSECEGAGALASSDGQGAGASITSRRNNRKGAGASTTIRPEEEEIRDADFEAYGLHHQRNLRDPSRQEEAQQEGEVGADARRQGEGRMSHARDSTASSWQFARLA